MRKSSFIAMAFLSAVACTSGSGGGATAARPSGSSTLITLDEISRGTYSTALDIVESLRPSMLRPRGMSLSNPNTTGVSADQAVSISVVVYLDEVRLGEPGRLSTIPAGSVREIRYINARDATTRWGTGVSSGVIQVISKR
jgi:hypothetical protein